MTGLKGGVVVVAAVDSRSLPFLEVEEDRKDVEALEVEEWLGPGSPMAAGSSTSSSAPRIRERSKDRREAVECERE